MKESQLGILVVVIVTSAVCTAGDYCLKLASEEKSAYWNRWLPLGMMLVASTNFTWVFVMKHMKLATLGAVFSVSITLMLAGTGFVFFNERLTSTEILGILLAIASLLLLGRFAE